MTYQELIHTYPPEQWVWKGKDYHCTVCYEQGEPCRDRIICDIADIQDNLEATGLFIDDMVVLTWLHEQRYSSLTHSIAQLTAMFQEHLRAASVAICKHVPSGIYTINSLPPFDADIYQELALAGAHS